MSRPLDELVDAPLTLGTDGERLDLDLRHWRARLDDGNRLWLIADQEGSDVNTVSESMLEELATLITEAERRRPAAVVLRSAKPAGFIVGADVKAFRDMRDAGEVKTLLDRAHEVVNALESLEATTIAVIHGHCLGGGLELALACDRRIARSDASLGFPEVQLGLHPGLGGTARLPQLVRPDQALNLMLTGKSVDAERALSMGLVDAVVEERHVAAAVRDAAAGNLASRGGGAAVTAMQLAPARQLLVRRARSETSKRVREAQYPAPFRLLELWEQHGDSRDAMLDHEPESFARLLTGDTSRNLVRVYFLREALRARGKGHQHGVRHVHVIGAGTMGGDIAAWCAHRGMLVTLEDQEARLIAPALRRAGDLFARKYQARRQRQAVADRLVPDAAGAGRAKADLIIEAVPEKLDLKRQIFRELEADARPEAILATNTSGILLEDIGEALRRPQRLAGLHFFNPVARMQLVEVVRHGAVDSDVLNALHAFAVAIDRLPVTVASFPGFLVNRVLTPYLLEALTLMDEGVQPERIDAAAEAFGMPMGPVALADQIGLDIALDVADGLHEKLDAPLPEVPDWLRRRVDDGDLGAKTGRGLYAYKNGEPQKSDVDVTPDEALTDRLILPAVNAAVTCLGAGVADNADAVDGALIFGAGFAPFLGGPLQYVRDRGPDEVRRRLSELASAHGARFEPSKHWDRVFQR